MPHQTIAYYIDRFAEGTITKEEWNILQELLREPENAGALDELLDRQLAGFAEDPIAYEDVIERVQKGVRESIAKERAAGRPVAHRVHFLRRWGWAAAAILLVAAGVFFWNRAAKPTVPVAAAPIDVAPGKHGAILTLADGSRMVLDSLGNGVIASQQGAQVILKNGQLAYDPTGAKEGAISYNTMTTPRGRQFRLTLPDGTKVWLNAASEIRYPTIFTGNERRVELSGEAYFEVARQNHMPFRVSTRNKMEIEVLGTSFNVNAYDNEESLNTTLLEGSVKVNAVLLRPGQQARVAESLQVVNDADIEKVTAWKDGLFNFEEASLPEVMRQLERWYNIEVVYENGIPNIRFGGEMTKDLSLAQVLRNLSDVGVRFRLEEGNRLIVTKK